MANRYDNLLSYMIYSIVFGYNEKRYWKLRQRIVDPNDRASRFTKMLWLIYLKKSEAKNASSMGTAINAGATFATPPILPHGITGIFVSHGAVIGRHCTILQNVIIGSSKGKAPIIGDNCVIGGGATIIGGVRIGDNCNIGANCTVFKDVPCNTTVVSPPPRYLDNKNTSEGRRF